MKCLRSKVKDSSEPGSLTHGSCEPTSLTTGSQRAKKQQLPGPLPRPEMLLFCDDDLCMNRKVNRQV
jgi:hypothetical protein